MSAILDNRLVLGPSATFRRPVTRSEPSSQHFDVLDQPIDADLRRTHDDARGSGVVDLIIDAETDVDPPL